jgi:hypothetical protein
MHENFSPCRDDGCGDGGERLRTVATVLAERGWSDDRIKQRVMTDPACVHPAWDDLWVQQEIEACISKVRPLEPKPVAAKKKVTQVSDDDIPSWLRDRIESLATPVDSYRHFHEVVAGLACRGWDSSRIMIKIAGRPWIPKCYAASHAALKWGVQLLLTVVPLRKIDDAAPDEAAPLPPWLRRSSLDEAAPEGLRPPAAVIDATAAEDAIAAWIDDRCERDAIAWESSAALFASWTTWAERAGENVGSQRRFAQTLESRGFQSQRRHDGRGFLGLRIPVEQSRSDP